MPRATFDEVAAPQRHTVRVLCRFGDPIAVGVGAFANDGSDAAATYAHRVGDRHDGIQFFGLGADGRWSPSTSSRGLLVINHDSVTQQFLHPGEPTSTLGQNGYERTRADEVLREMYAHGVSVIEVERDDSGTVRYRPESKLNRRIHAATDVLLAGPAAGSAALATRHSPMGLRTRGVLAGAHGVTPWGTYLACERNWADYFRRNPLADDWRRSRKELAAFERYGIGGAGRFAWATVKPDTDDQMFGRWNIEVGQGVAEDYRNAVNTFGWVVEIDPFAPDSTPKKRTALGRLVHGGISQAPAVAGKPLVWYMTCDSRHEYIYKFVSEAAWDPADVNRGLAAGDKYLDRGRLYSARFNADGTGEWIELAYGKNGIDGSYAAFPFADQVEVLINTRFAADAGGGTQMDQPAWSAVDPVTTGVYVALNSSTPPARTAAKVDAANPRAFSDTRRDGPIKSGNPFGHVIRWLERGRDPAATRFDWDIYAFGSRSASDPLNINVSGLTAENEFAEPDSLSFSSSSNILWLATDARHTGDTSNSMLLAALPGAVGDGGVRTITSTDDTGTRQVQTFLGTAPRDRLRRFLTAPVDAQFSGMSETPDGRTLFVNVQHPGDTTAFADIEQPAHYRSHWPDGGDARPRSATLAISRPDAGVIGV